LGLTANWLSREIAVPASVAATAEQASKALERDLSQRSGVMEIESLFQE
jgi:hypothetical protein